MSTEQQTTTGFNGLTAKGVPALPFWLLIVRFVILALSLGVLIDAAYNLSLFHGYESYFSDDYTGPPGFLIFDAIFTMLILGFMLVSEFFAPQLYIRLVWIVSLILAAIFWLSAWAWAASSAADFYNLFHRYGEDPTGDYASYGASLAVGAALGAVIWVLTIVLIVFFFLACMRNPNGSSFDRNAPPATTAVPPGGVPPTTTPGQESTLSELENGQMKVEHSPQPQVVTA